METVTQKKRVLFISYNGIEESTTQSQVLPYLKELRRRGHEIHLLTFEKEKMAPEALEETLRREGISWSALRYHKSPTPALMTTGSPLARYSAILMGLVPMLEFLFR